MKNEQESKWFFMTLFGASCIMVLSMGNWIPDTVAFIGILVWFGYCLYRGHK